MSILIKGMEMPKNCFDCMFHWHGDGTTYCLAQSKMHDLHHIKWECKGYEEQMKYREPTCPLVPVPPHWRLIDADEFVKSECNNCDGACEALPCDCLNCKADCRCEFMKDISEAPTIIPASGEGEA